MTSHRSPYQTHLPSALRAAKLHSPAAATAAAVVTSFPRILWALCWSMCAQPCPRKKRHQACTGSAPAQREDMASPGADAAAVLPASTLTGHVLTRAEAISQRGVGTPRTGETYVPRSGPLSPRGCCRRLRFRAVGHRCLKLVPRETFTCNFVERNQDDLSDVVFLAKMLFGVGFGERLVAFSELWYVVRSLFAVLCLC